MNMEAIKGFLAPLHVSTTSVRDALVCMFRSSPGCGSKPCLSETGCHWRYGRDSTEGLGIGIEWIYRLSASSLEVILMSDGRPLAFFLTAHFSQEDYPYDWQVRFITFACPYSCLGLGRLVHWLSKVRSTPRQYRRRH
jgi:hypothetical protein